MLLQLGNIVHAATVAEDVAIALRLNVLNSIVDLHVHFVPRTVRRVVTLFEEAFPSAFVATIDDLALLVRFEQLLLRLARVPLESWILLLVEGCFGFGIRLLAFNPRNVYALIGRNYRFAASSLNVGNGLG